MRKTTLVIMMGSLTAAGVGIWAMMTYVAADPGPASAVKRATATVSPIEIMQERGKNLPPAESVEPF
jgi:cytoskeletal protein RodZ